MTIAFFSTKPHSITPFDLAMACNDVENVHRYSVVGEQCFCDGNPIGKAWVHEDWKREGDTMVRQISLQLIQPAECIEVKLDMRNFK